MVSNSFGAAPALAARDLSFSYPAADGAGHVVLDGASLEVAQGEFCLIVGGNGAGKTTLLRLCKPEVAPEGAASGEILAFGRPVRELGVAASAELIGWVGQGPDGRLVCDTVWHELAFCLENLGMEQGEMRRRVAEVSYCLGLEPLFRQKTASLSGGQAQLVALAAALVAEPGMLLLDEPCAMLDPIARSEFAHALFRLNRELGITVVAATHEPWTLAPYATSCLRLEGGELRSVPLSEVGREPGLAIGGRPADTASRDATGSRAVALEECWQRYGADEPWVLRDCSLEAPHGQVSAVVGGNGSGKSTLLGVLAGALRIQRGRLIRPDERSQALLPQTPEALLACDTVADEIGEWARGGGADAARALADDLGIGDLMGRDPYDLSHGQRQLVALAKVLAASPSLLLADEPTRGLDADARLRVARALGGVAARGGAVVMATHDLALVRAFARETSMLFDGGVACTMPTADFFERNVLYG